MMTVTRWTRLGILILACTLLGPGVAGSESTHDEYDVKVAFIYNFAMLTRWPDSSFSDPTAPLTLAILGPRDFAASAEGFFAGRRVGRHPVEVFRISDPSEVSRYHVLFVSAAERNRNQKILEHARGARVLTIGETEGFASRGGSINFYRDGKKIRFEVNREAVRAAGLQLSSRLLRLARLVSSHEDYGD